jgi:polysaccharide export outer membrane protein
MLRRGIALTSLIAAGLLLHACAGAGGSAYNESPNRLSETAPTAREMEAPLRTQEAESLPAMPTNGHGTETPPEAATTVRKVKPPVPVAVKSDDPRVEEEMTMRTEDLHGYAFPGVEELSDPFSPTVDASARKNAQETAARLAAAERRLRELEEEVRRVPETMEAELQALEQQLATLEQRQPQPVAVTATGVEDQLESMRRRVAALEKTPVTMETRAVTPEMQNRIDALEAEVQAFKRQPVAMSDETAQRLAALEAEVARLERPSVTSSVPEPGQTAAQLEDLRERLRMLEEAPTSELPEIDPNLYARLDTLERQVASTPSTSDSDELTARLAALESEVARLEGRAPAANTDSLERFAALEAKIESLEARTQTAMATRPPQGVDGPVSNPFGAYSIGAGDLLEFQSFNDETLNRELQVRYDGNISLPLIPDVKVAGLTREQAETRVRDAYRSIFRDPQMSLLVRETTSKSFTIMGDIEQPGVYPYTGDTSLIEAISAAGGLRRRNSGSSTGGLVGITGQLTKAFIVRNIDGEREILPYDLRGIGEPGAHASDAPIYYGDLIYVPEGVNLVYVLGESSNPVIVELTEGMTLMQLLSLSGGFNSSTARLRSVVLLRQVDEDNTRVMNMNVRKMLRTGNDFPLNPGDIVYIPQKWLVRLSEFVDRFTGSISPVLNMYNSAVEAYYARDIAESTLETPRNLRTLERLNEIEQFGTSTQNLIDLFGAP